MTGVQTCALPILFLRLAALHIESPVTQLEQEIRDDWLFISSGGHSEILCPDFDSYFSVHDKFHRALVLSGFFFLKIASTFLNSSFFPKPIKRRIAI